MPPRNPLRLVLGILALSLAGLAAACISIGDAAPDLASLKEPTPTPDRTDCGEIQGTAFRSTEERAWFGENCNQWPPVSVPQTPARNSAANQEPPECAAIRGKPYVNSEQRSWYLANCSGNTSQANSIDLTTASEPQQGDRTNCDEIRGTPYRSPAERNWYQQNCPSVPSGGAGPDRINCNEIRGTSYRSPSERDWFQRNCSLESNDPGRNGQGNGNGGNGRGRN